MDKENKRKKSLIIIMIIIVLVPMAIYLIFSYHKEKIDRIRPISMSAKKIIDKYEKYQFGSPIKLKNTIITEGGSYTLTGAYDCITINTIGNVQLNLKNATINCQNGPAIYVEDSNIVNINILGTNSIEAYPTTDTEGAIFSKDSLIFTGDGSLKIKSNLDGITSKDSLMFQSGTYNLTTKGDAIKGRDSVIIENGSFEVNSQLDGIKSTNDEKITKGMIVIDDGTFNIISESDAIQAENNLIINDCSYNLQTKGNANLLSAKGLKGLNLIQVEKVNFILNTRDDAVYSDNQILIIKGNMKIQSDDDAIHSDGIIQIESGTLSLKSKEGLEATEMVINNGIITIEASEKGLTVGKKHLKYKQKLVINNGNIKITMGSRDSYAIDSSDSIFINGGTLDITAKETFFYSGEAKKNGGVLIINGKKTNKIPEMEVIERATIPSEQVPNQNQNNIRKKTDN